MSRGCWGSKFQKCEKFHELPRKSIKKITAEKKNVTTTPPHPTGGGGGGVKGENFKVTKHQLLKSISGMQLSWAKPGNPREGGREGRIGERGERDERRRGRESGRESPERSRVSIQLVYIYYMATRSPKITLSALNTVLSLPLRFSSYINLVDCNHNSSLQLYADVTLVSIASQS